MQSADHLEQGIELAVAAVRGADPGRYGDPTPCADFTVGKLVDHIAFGLLLAERAGLRQDMDPEWAVEGQAPYLVGRPEAEWAELIAEQGRRTVFAWRDPTAWVGETPFGGGTMPAAAAGQMMTAEMVVHGWDTAAATGQRYAVTPELAAAALAGVEGVAEMGRTGGWFGPEVVVPANAPAIDRALGASGRDPRWRP